MDKGIILSSLVSKSSGEWSFDAASVFKPELYLKPEFIQTKG